MASGQNSLKTAVSLYAQDFEQGEYPIWWDGAALVLTNRRLLDYQGLVKPKLVFAVDTSEIIETEYKYNLKEYGIKLHLKSGEAYLIKNKLKPQFSGLNEALALFRRGQAPDNSGLVREFTEERDKKTEEKEEVEVQKSAKFGAETNWTKPLPKWLIEAINSSRIGDEPVKIILMGSVAYAGALIAFEDRCVIAKGGVVGSFMASSLGGGRVTTFYYDQITGIEFNSGLLSGVLEVLTPSYQGTDNKDYWKGLTSKGVKNLNASDPWKLSNTLPIAKDDFKTAKPLVDALRKLISTSRRGASSSSGKQPNPTDLSVELLRLSELRDKGILSEEEFSAAKSKLLSS
jgi:hypothetical protein